VAFGYVIDVVRFYFHPNLFNIADLSNLVGAVLLLVGLKKKTKRKV